MAQQLVLSSLSKYAISLGFSSFLWIVPISVKAPKLVTFASLVSAIAGYSYAFKIAEFVQLDGRYRANQKLLRREIQHHEMATEAHFLMESITAQYQQQQPAEPMLLSASSSVVQTAPSNNDPQASEVQAYLNDLVELSQEVGWISASVVKRRKKSFRSYSPEEIREFFVALAETGTGQIRGEGNSLEWRS